MVKLLVISLLVLSGCGPLTPNVDVHTDGKVDTSGTMTITLEDLNAYFTTICQSQFKKPNDVSQCVSQYVTGFTNFIGRK